MLGAKENRHVFLFSNALLIAKKKEQTFTVKTIIEVGQP